MIDAPATGIDDCRLMIEKQRKYMVSPRWNNNQNLIPLGKPRLNKRKYGFNGASRVNGAGWMKISRGGPKGYSFFLMFLAGSIV